MSQAKAWSLLTTGNKTYSQCTEGHPTEVAEIIGTEVEQRSLFLPKNVKRPSKMVHTCNPNMWEVEAGGLEV